jgi:small-conductance mechanosensitive channel
LRSLIDLLTPWLVSIAEIAALVAGGLMLHAVVYAVARRVAARTRYEFDGFFVSRTRAPARLLLPLVLLTVAWPALDLQLKLPGLGQRLMSIAFVAAGAWFIVAVIGAVADWVSHRFPVNVEDNLRARQIQTQAQVLRRSATALIALIASALILLQIPGIETVGASLLASAGLAGIVVGLAARPAVGNLLAGLQLALTQPIRLDDVVIVEGEWGRIEEIRNTFVVVCIWDLRRLVVPLSYFIEQPFQNWTRRTANLLGTVEVHVDYATPVEPVRNELKRILDATPLWDGKVWNLQVTEADARTLKLRAMMSAPDAGTAWDLRCHVRERLVDFVQQRPQWLPRLRGEVQGAAVAESPGAALPHGEVSRA